MQKKSLSADASHVENHLYVEVPAMPEYVGRVRRQVAAFTQRQSWAEEEADDLLLAVGEACNNAVNYGGQNILDPRLVVSCLCLDERCLQVDIRNCGNGFHPDLSRVGRLPSDQLATHGRGFGLMLALVDQVQVLADGGNTIVRLTKSRTL